MDAERWRRVNEIFHAALELEAQQRDGYLESACGDDEELRAEVASLLASHEAAADFIAAPAFAGEGASTGPSLSADDEGSWAGQRLGPYTISTRIGRGGMGVVYRAVDTRLGRAVAIKSLARERVLDERSRARLRREAMAAAALSHPGIATVFNLEEIDGYLFIVYEFVDGPTLREELASGPCDLPRLAATGKAIAEALAAAHRMGIVHRDLKPENVIRTREGGIKILDFGLASFQDPPVLAGSLETHLTLPGTLLGTPAYMAPEQLRGEEVDFRADLFSFGVLLYELASGVHPFEGGDLASTIARVIEVDPDPLVLPRIVTPPALRRIVDRCLRKAPEERYVRTDDLVDALDKLCALAAAGEPEAHDDVARRLSDGVARALGPEPVDDEASPEVPGDAGAMDSATAATATADTALWWWRCHQLVVGVGYFFLLYPLWMVRSSALTNDSFAGWAAQLFFIAMVPIVVAGFLRIHLAFTSRYYPEQLPRQRARAAPLIRVAETALAVLALGGAAVIAGDRPFVAVALLGVGIGLPVVSTMIEPATTRAAFPGERT